MIRNGAKRVLVVDDEPSVREMLSDFLEMNNFICMQADNGESAVDVTRREKFDLIIMDIRMPGVSGIEALREIKRSAPAQPVIMVTAVSEVETAVEAMRLGANDYVMKPFVLHDMLSTVTHAMTNDRIRSVPEPEVGTESPLTIAVGTPLDDVQEPFGYADRKEVDMLLEEIADIQDQLAILAARVASLARPRLRSIPGYASLGPGGDAA